MASSTLRRTLAYLLEGELGLTRYRNEKNRKLDMSREDEAEADRLDGQACLAQRSPMRARLGD